MVNTELSGSPDCLLIPVDLVSTLGAQHVGLLVFIHVLHGNNEYNLGGVGEGGGTPPPPPLPHLLDHAHLTDPVKPTCHSHPLISASVIPP
jgi:hypothetical protein